jgi:hypothetical protein
MFYYLFFVCRDWKTWQNYIQCSLKFNITYSKRCKNVNIQSKIICMGTCMYIGMLFVHLFTFMPSFMYFTTMHDPLKCIFTSPHILNSTTACQTTKRRRSAVGWRWWPTRSFEWRWVDRQTNPYLSVSIIFIITIGNKLIVILYFSHIVSY